MMIILIKPSQIGYWWHPWRYD